MAQTIPVSPLALPMPELGVVRGIRLGAIAAGIRYKAAQIWFWQKWPPAPQWRAYLPNPNAPAHL